MFLLLVANLNLSVSWLLLDRDCISYTRRGSYCSLLVYFFNCFFFAGQIWEFDADQLGSIRSGWNFRDTHKTLACKCLTELPCHSENGVSTEEAKYMIAQASMNNNSEFLM